MGYREDVEDIVDGIREVIANAPLHKCFGSQERGHFNTPIEVYTCMLRRHGYTLGTTYHANGIGNNNEIPVMRSTFDADGYRIDKQIGKLDYVYDIYAKRAHVSFYDNTGARIFHDMGNLYSRDE